MNINMEFIENDNKFDMEFEGTQTINGGSVTAEDIKNALGYVPVNPENMPTKTSQLENDSGFLTAHQQLPTHLPNPQKLTFKLGGTTYEYDGNSAVSITIEDASEVAY